MKKILFATLLALVMVLSLAPVSLADCAHEHTYANWDFDDWNTVTYASVDNMYHTVTGDGKTYDYCEDCGEWVNVVKVPNMTQTMEHDYDENGVCQRCGHENTCTHTTTYDTWGVNDWDAVTYTSVDDKTHVVHGAGELCKYCYDCGQQLSAAAVEDVNMEQDHWYDENGVCQRCGHENACPHANTYSNWYFDNWDAVTYTSVDDRYHTISGAGATYDYCEDCGQRINVVNVPDMTRKMDHDYDENGVCRQCGHENACPHANTYANWNLTDWNAATYTSVDDKTHVVHGAGETYDYCQDCSQRLNVVSVADVNMEQDHWYDENGVCQQCGHENACTHANMNSSWYFDDWDAVTYTSVDDQYHTATGAGTTYDYCYDCGQQFNVVKDANMTQKMRHEYDDNGVCKQCGHENACAHANTYADWNLTDWNAATYTSVDDHYHTVTGDGETYDYCEDCGQRFNVVKVPNMTRKMEHDYDDNGVCQRCGHENACTHANMGASWYFNDWDAVTYTSVDDRYHTANGDGTTFDYCQDCGEWFNEVKVPNMTRKLEHDYDDNGVCRDCGHENACTHASKTASWSFDNWDAVTYTSVDDRYHTATGDGTTFDYCRDCGEWFNEVKVPNMTQKTEHDYDANGVCRDCGHKNACTHENVKTEIYFKDEVAYTSVNDKNHTASGAGWEVTLCEDCGKVFSAEEKEKVTRTEPHTFNENGVCSVCGASELTNIYVICEVVNGEDKLVFFNNGVLYFEKEDGETLHGWWRLPDGKLKVHLDVPGKVARANGLVVKIGITAYTITEEQMAELIRCLDVE